LCFDTLVKTGQYLKWIEGGGGGGRIVINLIPVTVSQ
jgi:hypothetical protein